MTVPRGTIAALPKEESLRTIGQALAGTTVFKALIEAAMWGTNLRKEFADV